MKLQNYFKITLGVQVGIANASRIGKKDDNTNIESYS